MMTLVRDISSFTGTVVASNAVLVTLEENSLYLIESPLAYNKWIMVIPRLSNKQVTQVDKVMCLMSNNPVTKSFRHVIM